MILIKNIQVYSPDPLGVADILIGGEKILSIGQNFDISTLALKAEVIDGKDMIGISKYIWKINLIKHNQVSLNLCWEKLINLSKEN